MARSLKLEYKGLLQVVRPKQVGAQSERVSTRFSWEDLLVSSNPRIPLRAFPAHFVLIPCWPIDAFMIPLIHRWHHFSVLWEYLLILLLKGSKVHQPYKVSVVTAEAWLKSCVWISIQQFLYRFGNLACHEMIGSSEVVWNGKWVEQQLHCHAKGKEGE